MVPSTVLSIAIFFTFVVPGTCYELIRSRTLFPAEETAFLQISRILLSGALVSITTLLLLTVVKAISPDALTDVPSLLGGTAYLATHWGVAFKTLVVQLLVGLLIVLIVCEFLSVRATGIIHRGTAMYGVTEVDKKRTDHPHLDVRLKGGTEVIGSFYGATTEYDPSKRELVLQQPILMTPQGGGRPKPIGTQYHRIVIPGNEIEYIYVSYVDTHVIKPPTGKIGKVVQWYRKQISRRWEHRRFRVLVQAAALLILLACSGIP